MGHEPAMQVAILGVSTLVPEGPAGIGAEAKAFCTGPPSYPPWGFGEPRRRRNLERGYPPCGILGGSGGCGKRVRKVRSAEGRGVSRAARGVRWPLDPPTPLGSHPKSPKSTRDCTSKSPKSARECTWKSPKSARECRQNRLGNAPKNRQTRLGIAPQNRQNRLGIAPGNRQNQLGNASPDREPARPATGNRETPTRETDPGMKRAG